MTDPFLSIIIPVHNEEQRLPPAMAKIIPFLESQPYSSEVIVVENGSIDRTYETAMAYTGQLPNLRVLRETRRGKGLAVRSGMLAAKGEHLFACDVDLSMPIEQINRFLSPSLQEIDIAIGSREAPGACAITSRLPSPDRADFISMVALVGFARTAGFAVRLQNVQPGGCAGYFQPANPDGHVFDVEVRYIARLHGLKICEVPIDWYFNPDSRVRLFNDSSTWLWTCGPSGAMATPGSLRLRE